MRLFKRRFKLWQICLLLLAFANIAYLVNGFFGWIFTLSFFLFVPGYLLLSHLKHGINERWEIISFSLGLSLLLLMIGGLVVNSLHVLGLQRPLTTWNIFILLDAITAGLIVLNRKTYFSLPRRPHPSKEQLVLYAILSSLPLLAIGGAIRLNNGASNVLTMIMYAVIPIVYAFLVLRKKHSTLYPYAIIMIGLSVLFSTSLRGWGITGHDIQQEFYVFQLTNNMSYWNISAFRDPYNACLSITILPTILEKLTRIPDPYIYKVIFQVIFAFCLLPVYLFIKKYSNPRVAFMGVLMCISLPTFLIDMPFLNRQEIAFTFFSLVLLVDFASFAFIKARSLLMLLMMFGLVVSHYSTAYLTLAILLVAYLFYKLFAGIIARNRLHKIEFPPILNYRLILVAILITFLWNSQITSTSGGLLSTIKKTSSSIINNTGSRSSDVMITILGGSQPEPYKLLNQYSKDNNVPEQNVSIIGIPVLPPTNFGAYINRYFTKSYTFNNLFRKLLSSSVQVLMVIGTVVLLVRFIKKKNENNSVNLYLLAMSCSAIMLLVWFILQPQLSVSYGTLRFIQQTMPILSIPIFIGLMAIIPLTNKAKYTVVVVYMVAMFWQSSGFIPQLIGVYPPQLSLNNSGDYYDAYYVHKSEIVSTNWVVSNLLSPATVASDDFASLRFLRYTINGRLISRPLLSANPGTYIYLDSANVSEGIYQLFTSGDRLRYRLNGDILQSKIYTNGSSDIYGKDI